MNSLPQWVSDPTTRLVGLYLVTLFGAVAMYIFSLQKGFEGAGPFLKKVLPDRSPVFYDRLDFILVTLTGSFIGWIVFAPTSSFQALAAGFGWVGAINVLISQGENRARNIQGNNNMTPPGGNK